jgi:hypothetical protein
MSETAEYPYPVVPDDVPESDDVWRVYSQEWVVVFTEGQVMGVGRVATTCEEFVEARFRLPDGRSKIWDTDVRVVSHPMLPHIRRVEARLWVLRGEYKVQSEADERQVRLVSDPGKSVVVPRGSRAEALLRDYGSKVVTGDGRQAE